ncbi:type II secretion system protein GspD [candidate division KSB1 bacterium]|nr:type II secretion system protein GspD [candidate division KSB1 bacterium]
MKRLIWFVICFFWVLSLYSQQVVQVVGNFIFLDQSTNKLEIGEIINLFRKSDEKEIEIGRARILKFEQDKAWAEILELKGTLTIKTGDYIKKEYQNENSVPPPNIPLVSNIFFETDLRQSLRDLAEESGIAIIPDNSVQGFVTLEFNNAPLEIVLTKLLTPLGYDYKKIDDYYLVGSIVPDNPSFAYLAETEYYSPNYLKSAQIPNLLSQFYKQYIQVNELTNSISITAPENIIKKIKASISKIDIPPKQISIEAIVAELSNEGRRSLGLDWGWFGGNENKMLTASSSMNSLSDDSSLVAQLLKTGINYKNMKYDVIYKLRALAVSGKANIKANPRITAINGQEASIFIGTERFFSIVTGPVNYPYARVERIPVGISLKITPQVSSHNEISVNIEAEVSEVTAVGSSGLPLVTKRIAQTSVRVKDGEVICIGGLVQETDMHTQKKIPFLGSIPLLGYVFSNTKTEKVKKEINIMITPKIL